MFKFMCRQSLPESTIMQAAFFLSIKKNFYLP